MNFELLKGYTPNFDELIIMDTQIFLGDVYVQFIGAVRSGQTVFIYALQFDEAAFLAEQQLEEKPPELNKRITNRQYMRLSETQPTYATPLQNLCSIETNGQSLEVSSSSSSRVCEHDWEKILLLHYFQSHGFEPCEKLLHLPFEGLMLTTIELYGSFESIPLSDAVRLHFNNDVVKIPVQKRLKLTVGKKYPRAYALSADHLFYIHSVSLLDFAEEIQKQFDDPHMQAKFSLEEIFRMKQEIRAHTRNVCPEGKRLPLIEYETQEDISLQIEMTQYLNARHDAPDGASAIAIFVSSDEKTGRHGLPIKAVALKTPVDKDVTELSVEVK